MHDQVFIYLIEKPGTKDHLYEVVDNKHTPKIHRLPAVHDPGAQYLHKVAIAQTYRQCGKWTAHQKPVIDTWICKQLHMLASLLGGQDDQFM